MTVRVAPLPSAQFSGVFDDLARLRITVFREYPYLYDGNIDYERGYLDRFLASSGAVVIGAFAGTRLVGAATASPLTDHHEEFAAPVVARGMPVDRMFYFGESVLEAAYRGQGAGVRFFEEREKAARDAGFAETVFSAVMRPASHPARPDSYRPLDRFWQNRGYRRLEGVTTTFSWKDIGEAGETAKPMEYWHKTLM